MLFERKKLAIIISALCLSGPAALVAAQEQQTAQQKNALPQTLNATTQTDVQQKNAKNSDDKQKNADIELPTAVVTGERTADQKGHDAVYDENVTSVYKGREELQRFKATNPGDVFKGMNGVYSMDSRSSQSITPNIRGVSGEGRVPLTIDGTEQSTNVWLHMFGAGNRNYADPALFRSIEVEKGPSLSRGVKSGVGGAVNIRTIDASDIIPQGDNWGLEINMEASGNSSKPKFDASKYYGKDYRDVPGAERVNTRGVAIDSPPPRFKNDGQIINFDNHSGMVALAGRNERVDFLASYSKRTQGNYYAGKKNADRYSGHPHFDKTTTDRYIPNLTKLYYPGNEIFNTASETKTTLIKNNWYFSNEQRLGLQFMRTDSTFGETTPGNSVLMWGYREGAEEAQPDLDWANQRQFVFEAPHSELKIDSYKLSYDIKPIDSDWLNLETSLWQTKASGTRYQTGISPYGLEMDDATAQALDDYDWFLGPLGGFTAEELESYGIFQPEHDGTIVSDGRQWTNHDRTGFDMSNQIRLADNLLLTVGGSYQQEKLDDRVQHSKKATNGFLPDGATLHSDTDRLGPRSGERKEYSAMMNLAWQPTDWLAVTAGTRYLHYKGKDTGTAKRRREKNEFYKASRRKAGLELKYRELMSPEDKAELAKLQASYTTARTAVDWNDSSNFKEYNIIHHATGGDQYGTVTIPTENAGVRAAAAELLDFLSARNANAFANNRQSTLLNADGSASTDDFQIGLYNLSLSYPVYGVASGNYWMKSVVVPYQDGKIDSSQNPFANGEVNANQTIVNPYDPNGGYINAVEPMGDTDVYQRLDEGLAWEAPAEQSGHAFSPVLSATARVTPYGTAFVRYAQTTRFPSIQELTSSAVIDGAGTQGALAEVAHKPERSINWEVGYAHDLTQFLPSLNVADVRLSYYNTEIKNFIDRSRSMDVIQFDKKKSSGLELQSRFDTGRVFGSLGATYRLKQKLCDKDYASGLDPFYNRIPSCMTGGFGLTASGSSLQPKYSIDMGLGTRLFNERLELGWRGVYHAGAENKQLDRLLSSENPADWRRNQSISDVWFRGGVDGFYWRSVLLHDLYANFNVNNAVALNLGITNVTDEYYLDPMAKTLLPGPGRTVTAGVKIKF